MQEKSVPLFDIIDTNHRRFVGVTDFVNMKFVMFYDLSGMDSPELHHLVILYKTYFSHMRFSVFVATHAPQIQIGSPVVINKKLINYHTLPLKQTTPRRRVKKVENSKR